MVVVVVVAAAVIVFFLLMLAVALVAEPISKAMGGGLKLNPFGTFVPGEKGVPKSTCRCVAPRRKSEPSRAFPGPS